MELKTKSRLKSLAIITTAFLMLSFGLYIDIAGSQNIVYASESSTEVEALVSRIDALPTKDDLGEQYVNEVKSLMEMFQGLPMSEQMYVSNYDKLNDAYKKFFKEGLITNEEDLEIREFEQKAERQNSKKESDTVESQVTEYIFKMKEGEKATIMVRYTADQNNDGVAEKPDRIVLVSPSAKSYPVSNTSIQMQDGNNIKAQLTWTESFLQIDLENAEPGTWSLETSVPVTISQQAYSGGVSEIKGEEVSSESKNEDENKTSSDEKENEKETAQEEIHDEDDKNAVEEEESSSSMAPILGIIAIAGILFFLKFRKSGGSGKSSKKGEEKKEEMSDEDILEQMKAFMREDDHEEESYATTADYENSNYSDDGFDDGYQEGDTSLLAKFEEDADKYYSSQGYQDPYEDYDRINSKDESNNDEPSDSAGDFFDLI